LVCIAAAIAALLVINAVVREPSLQVTGGHFTGAPPLPAVQVGKASAWRCPGPLPVGTGRENSRISIVNSGPEAVSAIVTVSRARLPRGGVSSGTAVATVDIEVRAHSQKLLSLARRGPAGLAAVSVDTDGSGIAVAESVLSGSTADESTGGGPPVISSPCSLGAATHGYLPTGSTLDGSDVKVSLYNPDATTAVVNLSVSTGAAESSPPAFEGVAVPATGLVVLDLRRWVLQRSALALTATAVTGDIVIGALESTSEVIAMPSRSKAGHGSTRIRFAGSSLLVGPDRGFSEWSFLARQSSGGMASTYAVYDPGTRSVSVSVAPPGRAGKAAAIVAEVPAGGIVDFAEPVIVGSTTPVGSVVISAKGHTPVVVARVTTRLRTRFLEEQEATAGTAGPHDEWLLPGAIVAPWTGDVVLLANPGNKSAAVTLSEFCPGAVEPVRLKVVELGAGVEIEVSLGSAGKPAEVFAVQVSATVPVLAEQQQMPQQGMITTAGGIPVIR
jgi:hypothetical protein